MSGIEVGIRNMETAVEALNALLKEVHGLQAEIERYKAVVNAAQQLMSGLRKDVGGFGGGIAVLNIVRSKDVHALKAALAEAKEAEHD